MRGSARIILVLLGPPGAGKGTQASRIAVHYDIPAISTGAMFREAVQRGTRLGRIVQKCRIDQGEYVPDEIVIDAVRERTSEPDCIPGFLLDGFPRTIPQADSLNSMLEQQGQALNGVLDIEAPINEIIGRFSGRRVCPVDGSTYHLVTQPPQQPGICDICHSKLIMRPDDNSDVVRRRLEVYEQKTAPLRDYYRNLGQLREIDATGDPETVFGQVVSVIEALKAQTTPVL